ncbi:hypothetical protein BKA93DRAFT_738661 [Sparassis latifolia]
MDVTNPYFNFSLDDDMSKMDTLATPSAFDFLSAFSSAAAAAQLSSPESASGSGSGSSSHLSDSPVGIDPQLVGTPAQGKPMSDFDEGDDENDEEDENEGEGEEPSMELITPVKVGGRGSAGRKGTVQSGGVVKRAGSEKKENKPVSMLSTTSVEPDDWRPSPEEYKKMTSKEKRQLRNKISARNFRVRRKEYITTLEGDIAERDRLIDAIRTELGSTKSENISLRQEISALKKALLEGAGRADTPVLPPPAPLPAIPSSVLGSRSSPTPAQQTKSALLTPNTKKDLPSSPRLGATGFWGGAAGGLGGFGGITPVHTTLIPEWGSVLSAKPVAGTKGRRSPALQENINPGLNGFTATALAGLMGVQPSQDKQQQQQQQVAGFETFLDTNPFTLKTLDPYRMQLWRNMAQQHLQHRQQAQDGQQASGSNTAPGAGTSGLASGLRPHYFSGKPVGSSLVPGKSAAGCYATPPNSPPLRASISPLSSSQSANEKKQVPTAQQAVLASLASQTLVRKLGAAFWDAFSAPAPSIGRSQWDVEKVRRVIEGSAIVRVVDIEPPVAAKSTKTAPMKSEAPTPHPAPAMSAKCQCFTEVLEEKMRGLTLGKK